MNRPIVITGCQRSGTTLLNLVLDSHPDITGIDEMDYYNFPLKEYLEHPRFHPCVSFKLPQSTYEAAIIKSAMPGVKVLWCIRDPRDVVLSMMRLMLKSGDEAPLPWLSHPVGAKNDIENGVRVLQKAMGGELGGHYAAYRGIAAKPPVQWSQEDLVFVGALCWRLKQELLAEFDTAGIPYLILRFESLVRDPERTIRDALTFIGLPWHGDVLRHHQLHTGESVGGTINSRPIDGANTGKWASAFDTRALSIIGTVCAGQAEKHGYALPK
jgi:hypothetical protein